MTTITEVFTYSGAPVIWSKPAGITSLTIIAVGGGGGGGRIFGTLNPNFGYGGNGAIVVTNFENLTSSSYNININVGQGGNSGFNSGTGGYLNGGNGGQTYGNYSGGGGGMTSLISLIDNIKVIAGGGGGAAYGTEGGNGGNAGNPINGNGLNGNNGTTDIGEISYGGGGGISSTGGGGAKGTGNNANGFDGLDYNLGGNGGDGSTNIDFEQLISGGGGGGGHGGGGGGGSSLNNGTTVGGGGGGGGGGSYSNGITVSYSIGPYLSVYGKGGIPNNNGENGYVIISYVLPKPKDCACPKPVFSKLGANFGGNNNTPGSLASQASRYSILVQQPRAGRLQKVGQYVDQYGYATPPPPPRNRFG